MEIIVELIFNFILEILANLFFQILVELGLRSLAEPFRMSDGRHPVLAFIGCILLGTATGIISSELFPTHLFHTSFLPGSSLLFVPLGCGSAMAALRRLREHQGKKVVFLDSFVYGYTFAFFMTLVRYYRIW